MCTTARTVPDPELPKYKCHKVVQALKISKTVKNPNGSVSLFFEDKRFNSKTLEGSESDRFSGEPDLGYYVVYEDGYTTWSPTEAFEKGYTLKKEDEVGQV